MAQKSHILKDLSSTSCPRFIDTGPVVYQHGVGGLQSKQENKASGARMGQDGGTLLMETELVTAEAISEEAGSD